MSSSARRPPKKRHRRHRPALLTTCRVPVPLLRGESFGPYTLREQLGEGGTCAVFAAERHGSGEPLAIKVLHPKLAADPTLAERMLDEAYMIAALRHPGIVEVYDIGRSTTGRPFVVLERLIGEPLSARLARGRLPEHRIVTFMRQLASALDVAHRDGIVHRDLKPENIYLVADPASPGGEHIKLLDFGIAKRERSDVNTATGIVLGTPAYMAPEQARGMRRLDGRTDMYALGVVMYVMATGALPFTGANTDEILAEHVYCKPVPASDLVDITPGLSAIIQRCLAKHPDERYANMAELEAALAEVDALLAGVPGYRPPGPPPAPPRRWSWLGGLALLAPSAVVLLIKTMGGDAPKAVAPAPPPVAPPAVLVEPTARLEPPALTKRQVRRPQPVVTVDTEATRSPRPAPPAPPSSPRHAASAKLAQDARPAPPAQPAKPAKPAKNVRPAPPAQPMKLVKEAKPAKPAPPAKPAKEVKPAPPGKPAPPAQPELRWDPDALWYPRHEPRLQGSGTDDSANR